MRRTAFCGPAACGMAASTAPTRDRSSWAAFATPLSTARDAGIAGVAFVNGKGQVLHSDGGLAKALPIVRSSHAPRRVRVSRARLTAVVQPDVLWFGMEWCLQGSIAVTLAGRFDFAPPSRAASRDAASGAPERAVGAARRDGASIVLGARKFLVTEADHCDLLAVSAAAGGVPVGVFLAAVPFGAVAVLFR